MGGGEWEWAGGGGRGMLFLCLSICFFIIFFPKSTGAAIHTQHCHMFYVEGRRGGRYVYIVERERETEREIEGEMLYMFEPVALYVFPFWRCNKRDHKQCCQPPTLSTRVSPYSSETGGFSFS